MASAITWKRLLPHLSSFFGGFVMPSAHRQAQMADAWVNHTGESIRGLVDSIPILGHIDGIVHFAMGETEEGIHAEEQATRTIFVLGGGAMGGPGGAVAGGALADAGLTGIESLRHHRYDPQGYFAVGTNLYNDFDDMIHRQNLTVEDVDRSLDNLQDDLFDLQVLGLTDGLPAAGSKGKVSPTTTIYRVEGKSIVKDGDKFFAGDNQRIFNYQGNVVAREQLPGLRPIEELANKPGPEIPEGDPKENEINPGKGKGKGKGKGQGNQAPDNLEQELRTFNRIGIDGKLFKDNGKVIFLNFGQRSRMLGYYAQKLIDHRTLVEKYRATLEAERPGGSKTAVTERTHDIRVKSFKVLTRDLEQTEKDAITEQEKKVFRDAEAKVKKAEAAIAKAQAQIDKAESPQGSSQPDIDIQKARADLEAAKADLEKANAEFEKAPKDKGVLVVDVKAPRQYGLQNWRYTPIFEKVIPGTADVNTPWIASLPTPILKLIRDNPVALGKILTFKYAGTATGAGAQSANHLFPKNLQYVKQDDQISMDAVTPVKLLHCRHVKQKIHSFQDGSDDWIEHYEYLIKFDENSEPEWYPADLISPDLRQSFYDGVVKSAKPIANFKGGKDGQLFVQYEDGTEGTVDNTQVFWQEFEPSEQEQLDPREIDSILYHAQNTDTRYDGRYHLKRDDEFPLVNGAGAVEWKSASGKPMYLGSAIDFHGTVHPCMVVADEVPHCVGTFGGRAEPHNGAYDLLPFNPDIMEFVDSYGGRIPEGREGVVGGYENNRQPLYHAVTNVNGHWWVGKAGPQFNGSLVPVGGEEMGSGESYILVWK